MVTTARQRFRTLLSTPGCRVAAPVFDTLSAHIAGLLGWEIAKLSGSVFKLAHLALPDELSLSNVTDLAAVCARITGIADMPLIVDADDGGGSAISIFRFVRDLESAGVAAIEIDDRSGGRSWAEPNREGAPSPSGATFVSIACQMGRLQAAVAARRDLSTVIVARTNALLQLPRDEAMDRIRAYSESGAEALMLEGVPCGRYDIEAVRRCTDLPLCILNVPTDAIDDPTFLEAHGVRVRFVGHAVFRKVVAILVEELRQSETSPTADRLINRRFDVTLEALNRSDTLKAWSHSYDR